MTPLFHLSFKEDLEGIWTPQIPDGSDIEIAEASFPEPSLARISCSPSIIQCFQAIYPNVKHFFDQEKYPHMDFYVYEPEITSAVKVLPPEKLIKDRMVHDAFLTEEHLILSRVKMTLVAKVRIDNVTPVKKIYYHPFNDNKLPKDSWIPGGFSYTLLESYKEVVTKQLAVQAKPRPSIVEKWQRKT